MPRQSHARRASPDDTDLGLERGSTDVILARSNHCIDPVSLKVPRSNGITTRAETAIERRFLETPYPTSRKAR